MRLIVAVLSLCITAGLLLAAVPAISPASSSAAREKIERVQNGKLRKGETVILSEEELNSFFRFDYASEIPDGVRDLRVRILKDLGEAQAYVDLARVQEARGSSLSGLWALMFSGERRLKAVCRYISAEGRAIAEIESAELDGTSIPGPVLEWLVSNLVASEVEGFALGEPMPLPDNLRQIRLEPGQVEVMAY